MLVHTYIPECEPCRQTACLECRYPERAPVHGPWPNSTFVDLRQIDWSAVRLTPALCVVRGAMHLQYYHSDALSTVDVDRLDMGNCHNCVLGQLYGRYQDSFELRELGRDFCAAHGFATPRESAPDGYDALTDLWCATLEGMGVR